MEEIQKQLRILLQTEESTAKRTQSIQALLDLIANPDYADLLLQNNEKLLNTVKQLYNDRVGVVRQQIGTVVGRLAAIAKQDYGKFLRWLFQSISTTKGDRKGMFIGTLREFLQVADATSLTSFAQMVSINVQATLDENQNFDQLPSLIELVLFLSEKYPDAFKHQFCDVMDILIGWRLDPSIPEHTTVLITDTFFKLRSYWEQNLTFAVDMISKLLQDMFRLVDKSAAIAVQNNNTPNKNMAPKLPYEMFSFLACVVAITKALGTTIVSNPIGSNALTRFLVCLKSVQERYQDPAWLLPANQAVLEIAELLEEKFNPFHLKALEFLLVQLACNPSTSILKEILKIQIKLLKSEKNCLTLGAVQRLLSDEVLKLRLNTQFQITELIEAVFRLIIKAYKSQDSVQLTIDTLSEESQQLYKQLSTAKPFVATKERSQYQPKQNTSTGDASKDSKAKLSDEDAVRLLSFNLAVLGSITTHNSKQFDVIYEMISTKYHPIEDPVIVKYSQLHLTAVKTFLELNMTKGMNINSPQINEMLIALLKPEWPLKLRLYIIDWIQERFHILGASDDAVELTPTSSLSLSQIPDDDKPETAAAEMMPSDLLYGLLDLVNDMENEIRVKIAESLQQLTKPNLSILNAEQLDLVFDVCLCKLDDVKPNIAAAYLKILGNISPAKLITGSYAHNSQRFVTARIPNGLPTMISLTLEMDWKHKLQELLAEGNESSAKDVFARVLALLGMKEGEDPIPTLIKNFQTAATMWGPEPLGVWGRGGPLARMVAITWALEEVARYCISTKLRTPLGNPAQTLEGLERVALGMAGLNDLALKEAMTSVIQNVKHNTLELVFSNIDNDVKIRGNRLISLRALLDFINTLEKLMYNAFEGSINLPPISVQQTSIFFRGNKKTCLQWFTRMRQSAMLTSVVCNSHSDVIKYGMERVVMLSKEIQMANMNPSSVKDPKKLKRVVEHDLMCIANAMYQLREFDALEGLFHWCRTHFAPRKKPEPKEEEAPPAPVEKPQEKGKQQKNTNGGRGRKDKKPQQQPIVQILAPKKKEVNDSINVDVSWMKATVAQAKGRYERALEEYRGIMSRNYGAVIEGQTHNLSDNTSTDQFGFLFRQITDCFIKITDWDQASEWINDMRQLAANQKYLGDIVEKEESKRYLEALMDFERGNLGICNSKMQQVWQQFGGVSYSDWPDPLTRLKKSEELLLNVMAVDPLGRYSKRKPDRTMIKTCITRLQVCRLLLETPLLLASSNSLQESAPYLMQLHCTNILEQALRAAMVGTENAKSMDTMIPVTSLSPYSHDIGAWMKVARVQKYINDEVDVDSMVRLVKLSRKQANFKLATRLLEAIKPTDEESELVLRFERSKLLRAQNTPNEAVLQLWDVISDIKKQNVKAPKPMLKLAKWFQYDKESLDFGLLKTKITELDTATLSKGTKQIPKSLDSVIQSMYQDVTKLNDNSMEAWIRYGDWCHYQANKELKHISDKGLELTANEQSTLHEIVSKASGANGEDLNKVIKNVQDQLISRVGEGHIDDEALEESHDVSLRNQIAKEFAALCPASTTEHTEEFIAFWSQLRTRALAPLARAVVAYQRALQLSPSVPTSSVLCSALRLLRIVTQWGRDVHPTPLVDTPTAPWRALTPQLTARMRNNDVAALLLRIAGDAPQLVAWLALAGTRKSQRPPLLNQLVNDLSNAHPTLIDEMQTLMTELTRITLLWEEHVAMVLREVQGDVSNRSRTLRDEVNRINENGSLAAPEKLKLIQEKYNTIMKPAIVKLERLIQHTSVDPSTPHEVWFQKTFNESLNNALQSFKAPQDPVDPLAAFAPFITLLKELVRQARPSTLELHEISPKLAKIDSSSILMPGVQDYVQSDEPVTINSFSPNVVVLPTKTRPRKLVLVGSDGRQYPYLLKGREDLHLDERMMQFLTVVNMLLKKDKQTAARGLRARNYAVIPLSDMSGLIQWVEGTAPLYQVYTQFVKRNNAYNSVVAAAQNQDKDQAPKPEPNKNIRPIDMFYAKIIPALKAKGIKSMSRHDWPLDIQKKVFLELEKETPRDLLEKELWCASESTGEWWKKVQAYSRSAAVMSMVGYIIGLGDRHLDNILIDYKTGEVVHIDYNVCFEKGLKLRVPEIVPFRMTQNMQRALGITGVEGSFRTACEQSLRVLRRNKETLLTLLEAFVYDPLVDWTTNKAAFEEKMMELSVTLSLFCSRVDEMKTVTKDAHDSFASRFPSLVGALASMENTRQKLIDMKKNTSEKHQKLGTVKESLSKTIAALSKSTTFDGRIVKEKQLAEERDNMEKKITATVKQLASTREAHFRSLALLKEPLALINEVKLSLTVPRTLAQVSSIDLPMREDILRRCGEVDLEMSRLITHREMLAVQCIELMNTYKSITSQLPTSYLGNTSLREWETLLNLLLAEPTPETMLKIEQYMDEASWKQAADRDRAIEKQLFQQVTALSQKWVNASSLVTPTIAKAEKFDLQTKQLRDQLLMMTSSINAQSGSTNASRFVQSLCLMLLADVSERVNGIQSLDVNAPPPNASGSWLWNTLSDLLDKSTFVGTIVRDSWADDPIKAAEIHADIIFSLEETIAPSVNTLLTNFTNLLLPQLVTIVQSNDQTVQDVLKNIARMAEQVKKFPSQDVSKIKPQSLDDETFGSLDPKDDEEEEDIVWDMPTKPASSKTGSSFFDLPEGNVKQEYDALVRSVPGAQLNAGKLLVSTFDALFQTLEKQHFELMDNCNEELTEFSVQQPLESVFFDQKLMTINSVLTTATELNGAPSTSTFTAKMTEHMGQFINAYAHKLFAPIVRALVLRFVNVRMPIKVDTTAVSEQLLKTSLLTWIQTNSVTVPYADQLTKILSDVTNCRDAWRLAATEKTTLLTEVPKLEAELNKTRLEYAQFTWMHEESLKYESADVSSQALMRSKLLENLTTNVQAIQNIDKAIRECNKSHSDLETEVLKAMQWHYSQFTPKGKQVNDHPTVKTFQEAIQLRRQMVTLLFDKVKNVSDLCMAIVDLETSRAPPKSKSPLAINVAHQNYFQLAQQYFQSAHSLHQLRTEIDDTKKNTEQLTKDHKELSKASAELNSEVANLSAVIGDYQQKYNSNKGIVKNSLNHVQNAFEGYTQFSNEVESLLSNIVNITDEKWESVAQMHALAKKLQRNLKSLVTDLETFTKMASDFLALSDNDNKADVDTQKSVDNIRSRADKLVALENKIGQQVNELVAQSTEWQAQQSDGPLTQNSQEVSVDEADQSDKPRALMKNSTALSILKRVRDKLEGRDKSGDKKWTIPEQVEWTIHEATSLDNLAQLYEGWTAWI